jgi:hypothetical protein
MSFRNCDLDALAPKRQPVGVGQRRDAGTIAMSTTALQSAVTRRVREHSSILISLCGKRCPTSTNGARRLPADNDV